MDVLDVQIITYAPTVFYHCQHCEIAFDEIGVGGRVHREQAREALPDDLRRDFDDVALAVHDLSERWGSRVRVRVVDAASIEGFWKSLRHRINRYPTLIVNGRRVDRPALEALGAVVEQSMNDTDETAGGIVPKVTSRGRPQ